MLSFIHNSKPLLSFIFNDRNYVTLLLDTK